MGVNRMTKELFTNEILIDADNRRIEQLLLNLENIIKWNPEIKQVATIDHDEYMILRHGGALNTTETIKVTQRGNTIEYESFDGTINYLIEWELESLSRHQTRLKQTLSLTSTTALNGVALMLKPVIRNAFQDNLTGIKRVVETMEAIY
ncbi:MAG: SRPBCC family protein, partial [Limosilactobacillus sp.]|nr:SRPBCC family protein [Limosilactobacillus sp.]